MNWLWGTMVRQKNRGELVGFGCVMLIAVCFRLIAIDKQGLDTDEAWTLALSLWSPWEMITLPTDVHPFLYYWMHRTFFDPHDSAITVRLLSVSFGLLSVALMYFLGRLYFGARGALVSAALLAVWTPHVDYSMEARNYSAVFFFILLMAYGFSLFWSAVSEPGPGSGRDEARRQQVAGLLIFAAGCVLAFYTHVISAFPIAYYCAILWIGSWFFARERFLDVTITMVGMAVLAFPGMIWFWKVTSGDHLFNWLSQSSLTVFISTMADFDLPIGMWDNDLTNGLDIRLIAKTVLIGMFSLLGLVLFIVKRKQLYGYVAHRPALGIIILASAVLPVVIWCVGFVSTPIFMGRSILFSVAGVILLITALVTPSSGRGGVLLSCLLVGAYAASTVAYGFMREELDWRGAVAYLEENVASTDLIGLTPSFNYLAINHPATKPTGAAMILTTFKGTQMLALGSLGGNPDWAQDYFVTLEKHLPTTSRTLEVPAGTVIWRVDGQRQPHSIQTTVQEDFFGRLGKGDLVWFQKSKYESGNSLSIYRYVVEEPISIEVERMLDASRLESH